MDRHVAASPEPVRAAMSDAQAFMEAGGFDEVSVDGDRIHLQNGVGLLTIDLELRRLPDADADFAYEQVEGIFSSMETRFVVRPAGGGSEVTATTEFALDASIVGPILESTIVKRQRRREFAGHFEYLAAIDAA